MSCARSRSRTRSSSSTTAAGTRHRCESTRIAEQDPCLVPVHLSRNFGHQAAVSAGLDHAKGRGVVIMDGDLQDPPEVIPQFVQLWRLGNDVVYAIREKRKENVVKRLGYFLFYRLLQTISDLDIPLDSGDFCLMDRKAVDALTGLPERCRFIRGLRTFVGFRQVGLIYERAPPCARRGNRNIPWARSFDWPPTA